MSLIKEQYQFNVDNMNFNNKKKPHEIIKSKIAQFIPRGDRCDA